MEHLKAQQGIIRLGKLLVSQLGLEDRADTLGRWMAHYIAEKMITAEKATGKEKAEAEKTCFDTILAVWKHRWELQAHSRPFKNFERILELIQQMDPEAAEPHYLNRENRIPKAGESPWLIAAYHTDQAAKVCLEYLLKEAAVESATSDTAEYLEAAKSLFDEPDTAVISALFDKKDYDYDIDTRKFKKGDFDSDYRKAYLQKRIDHLDSFSKQVNQIKAAMEAELKPIPINKRKTKPKTD